MSSKDYKEIKAILLGDVGVGKTNLINVSVGMAFDKNEKSTISNSFVTKKTTINKQKYNIDLWDTAGQEKYYQITKIFFKGSNVIIFVYDVTSKSSFEGLSKWMDMAKETTDGQYVCGIVGNKNDLYLQAKVDEKEARDLAESKGYKFKLVSAFKDPKGIQDFIDDLAKDYINMGGDGKQGVKLGGGGSENQGKGRKC
jgi:small GTP-binding protein